MFRCVAEVPSVDEAVGAWYDESKDYDYSFGSFSPRTSSFTQMLWKGATSVGMASSDDGRYIVANYAPAGNCMGEFQSNVLPLQTAGKGKRKARLESATQRGFPVSPMKKLSKGLAGIMKSPVKSSKCQRQRRAPLCIRPGCGKPSWNGREGEYCTTQVWSASFASCHHLW